MNVVGDLLTAYYNALKDHCTVYKITVPLGVTGDYVWLYPEGGVENNTKSSKNDDVIIRVDVVTQFQTDVDQTTLEDADSIVNGILIPSASSNGLSAPSGLQILNVKRDNYSYFIEQNDKGIIYRKTSRYSQRVHQI